MSYQSKSLKAAYKQAIIYILLFVSFLVIGEKAVNASPALRNEVAALDCNTTASSVGLDIVLPIQAGAESFKTGYWVYQTARSDHTGKDSCALDFFDVIGKRVVAVADGKVEKAKWNNVNNKAEGYGYYVLVLHEKDGKNYYSVYSHLQDPDSAGFPLECKVAPPLSVKAGDCIGISGNTGISPIDHLHFSMWSGTGPFSNTSPIAPEDMRGIKLYGKIGPQKPVTTMATAERVTWILPALSLKLNEVQSRTYVFTNTSKITWDKSNVFELVKVSGSATGAPEKIALPEAVEPGKDVAITIPIKGTSPGLFESEWQLHHNNVAFGPTVPLIYTVGVETGDVSNLPSNLWGLIKPIIFNYVKSLLIDYLNRLVQDILNSFLQTCGLAPVGFAGIMFSMVMAGRKKRDLFNFGGKWTGQGSWLTIFGQLIGTAAIFIVSFLMFKVGRELIWWNGVIKSTGYVILGLALLLLVWSAMRLFRSLKDLGLKRLTIIVVVILLPMIFLHGQRYRADEPILVRYTSSIGDLSLLAKVKATDYWNAGEEFANEFAVLTGIKSPHSPTTQPSAATATPDQNSPQQAASSATPKANAEATEINSTCDLVWDTYRQEDLSGKNRSQVWEEIVLEQVNGSGMTASQFYDLVVEKNPHLVTDGYEFKKGKKYLLPQCK